MRTIRATDLVCFGLFVLFALLMRAPYLGDLAPDYDEQLYQLIGRQMLHGAVPFVDIWDRKPVGLFLIYAGANLVGQTVWSYQLLALGCAIWAAMLVFRLARQVTDDVGAAVAGLLYILYLSAFGSYAGQSEVFCIPILLVMTQWTIRVLRSKEAGEVLRLSVRVMILGGLCLQIKYTVLPQCAFFALICLWKMRFLGVSLLGLAGRAVQFALIGLTPTAIVALVYLAIGHFDAFAFANFWSIFDRGALTGSLRESYRQRVEIMLVPLLIPAAIALVRQLVGRKGMSVTYLVAAGWMLSALASAMMVGNIYIYYFGPVIPGLVILAAPAFAVSRLGAVLASFTMLAGVVFYSPVYHQRISAENRAGLAAIIRLATPFVGNRKNCLYVFDGPTALYQETHSCLPTRFVYPDHLNNAQEERALGIDPAREVTHILANRPAVIVTASEPVVPVYNAATTALVDRAVVRDYVRVGSFRFNPRWLIVHVRRDLLRASRSGLSSTSR